MAPSKRTADFAALEIVHGALAPLDPETRGRVLSSVSQLLEVTGFTAPAGSIGLTGLAPSVSMSPSVPGPGRGPSASGRPLSLVELVQDKKPSTSPEKIAVFAYYREKHEGLTSFSRDDIRPYFSKARMPPPGNYDRDFVNAVKAGWIHEDGAESYLTSRGVEAVESGFSGAAPAASRGSGAKKSRRKARKTRKTTRRGSK